MWRSLGATHQSGTQSVALHVAENRQNLAIVLAGKYLELPLSNVVTGTANSTGTQDVGCQQPLHSTRQVAVAVGPRHRMEVVGRNSVSQHAHWQAGLGVGDGYQEGQVVVGLVEDFGAAVAPVPGVIAISG